VALLRLQRQRFVAVMLAGAVGLVASLAFVGLSAPDLAMTQLSVDVVSTVLLLMGLALLPQSSPRESSALRRGRDAAGRGRRRRHRLADLADADARPRLHQLVLPREVAHQAGGGTNAVNVILVDFRGYDTFGEITVLGIAGVGVLALLDGLRVRRPGPTRRAGPGASRAAADAAHGAAWCCRWRWWCRPTSSGAATTCPVAASSPAW
jgi:multicomponent K+:H+ antiporter subunit A